MNYVITHSRIQDELFEGICKIVDHSVSRRETDERSSRSRGRGRGAGRTSGCGGRAQRATRQTDGEEVDSSGKLTLSSGAQPTIVNFIPTNARRLKSKIPIPTANGTIYPSHSATLKMTTTRGVTLKLQCLICNDVTDNLVSVLDVANRYNAVLFDGTDA